MLKLNAKPLGIKSYGGCMGNKPKEKLSNRLTELFITSVNNYELPFWKYIVRATNNNGTLAPTLHVARKMSEHVMDMIAEYEPEDIE